MYYPKQIPFILNKNFSNNIIYTEKAFEKGNPFIICFWEMKPCTQNKIMIKNVIVTDGCIDLVVLFDEKKIGFSGMSKTNFDYDDDLSGRAFGFRLKPGAFCSLTGLSANNAMDSFLPISEFDVNFNEKDFFALEFDDAKVIINEYINKLIENKKPDIYTSLFDKLSNEPPETTKELYEMLRFSPRKCQRKFAKHFGLRPQTVLSIIRFQKCLELMTSDNIRPLDVLSISTYYDQSHFIKDFKRNIGLTPLEFLKIYNL